jgi:hypothetical protein
VAGSADIAAPKVATGVPTPDEDHDDPTIALSMAHRYLAAMTALCLDMA